MDMTGEEDLASTPTHTPALLGLFLSARYTARSEMGANVRHNRPRTCPEGFSGKWRRQTLSQEA